MSGIFGIVSRKGEKIQLSDLEKMNNALCHLGYDGGKMAVSGSAALGQRLMEFNENPQTGHPLYSRSTVRSPRKSSRRDHRTGIRRSLGCIW